LEPTQSSLSRHPEEQSDKGYPVGGIALLIEDASLRSA